MGWLLRIHFWGEWRLDVDQCDAELLGLGVEECGCKVWRQGTDGCLYRVSVKLGFCSAKAPWQNVVARYSCVCTILRVVGVSAWVMCSNSLQRVVVMLHLPLIPILALDTKY